MKQVITSREQTTAEYYLRYMVENNSKRKLFCKEKYICIPTKVALEIADAIEKSREKVNVVRCKDCRWGKKVCGNVECSVDSNLPPEYHGYNWFCPNGE